MRPANPPLAIGAALVTAVAATALLSLAWTPWPAEAIDIAARLRPPSPSHPFGADAFGRDGLSQVMAGARPALLVACAACVLGLGLGVPAGLLAAARGGWADEAVTRTGDVVFAFPALLLAVLIAAALGPGTVDAVVALGVYSAPVFAKVTRTGARTQWSLGYTLAARAAGQGPAAVSVRHILPNLAGTLAVQAALQLSLAVVGEAALAYLGLSAQPPTPSWGRMLAEAQTYYAQAPWLALFPGGAVVITVLGFSLLGEGLRRRFAGAGR